MANSTNSSGFCEDTDCLCHWIENFRHCSICGELVDASGPAGMSAHVCARPEPMEKAKPIIYEEDGDVLWA